MTEILSGWTVYDHPSDYPDEFVARRWIASKGGVIATAEILTSPAIVRLRAKLIQKGLYRLERSPGDDAKIIEVWI